LRKGLNHLEDINRGWTRMTENQQVTQAIYRLLRGVGAGGGLKDKCGWNLNLAICCLN
jgi:hypothetical protein